MPEENIDEIIQEILSEEKKVEEAPEEEVIPTEELYECPVCHHQVYEDAKFCPYCYAVFEEDVDYRNLIETLIKKLKFVIPLAQKLNVPLASVNENIKEAKKFATSDDYPSGYAHLQEAYYTVVKGIVDAYQQELEKYEVMMGLDTEIRDMYTRAKDYLDEWDLESFTKLFEKLTKKASEVSKDLKSYLDKLESVENALKIAKDFGIDTTKAEKVVDTSKDMADAKKYADAAKLLNEALLPIKDEIEAKMEPFLKMVKEEVMRSTYSGSSDAKTVIRLVRELKVYKDEGNLIKVLQKMDEISKEMSKQE